MVGEAMWAHDKTWLGLLSKFYNDYQYFLDYLLHIINVM